MHYTPTSDTNRQSRVAMRHFTLSAPHGENVKCEFLIKNKCVNCSYGSVQKRNVRALLRLSNRQFRKQL